MVTLVPGKSRCTASAMTCAVELADEGQGVRVIGREGGQGGGGLDRSVQVNDAIGEGGDGLGRELVDARQEFACGLFHGLNSS